MAIDTVICYLEIIGEAATHNPDSWQEQYPDVPWRLVKSMRNLLVHEYWGVDLILWSQNVQNLG